MTEHHLYTNRLINQKSPYLLQHAHNPVNWYPWGEEAFQAAKDEDKPIFLSIGYATCHWCHVMERESFEDVEVAQMMNKHFISIKVDREELPEIDSLYMDFAQSMMAGSAGWPLNVILTPELQPFFAATYLPPNSRHGLMGLKDLITRISDLWQSEERERILNQAEKIVEIFAESVHAYGEELPEEDQIASSVDLLYRMADPVYGGIKGAPKFPIGYQLSFLLDYYNYEEDSRALFLVEKTLDMMHRGGIYDHLGGGFSRYSVDEKWLVPHFEKMLYDNAILAQSYLDGWLLTKNPLYKRVCEEIIEYILRDMTHPDGGFYSAEDADSEGHEGKFYTWSYDEVLRIFGEKEAALFCEFYDISPQGNFEGTNILHTTLTLEEFASKHNLDVRQLDRTFAEQRKKLWEEREKRVHPLKDDKILSAWNGLMIYALARAGVAFNNDNYLNAAVKAARFIRNHLWIDGNLLRRWREGQPKFSAGLDEYAYMIRGLLALFEANAGTEWLQWAMEMAEILKKDFKEEEGAFYQTDGQDPNIILRKCQFSDGAEPSGNAIHCENLLHLYQLTSRNDYKQEAEDILKAVNEYLENYPPGYCYHLNNLLRYYDKEAPTIVVALNSKKEHEMEIRKLIFEKFLPHLAFIWYQPDIELEELLPLVQAQKSIDDQTIMYICHEGVCQQPLSDLSSMKEAIQKL